MDEYVAVVAVVVVASVLLLRPVVEVAIVDSIDSFVIVIAVVVH